MAWRPGSLASTNHAWRLAVVLSAASVIATSALAQTVVVDGRTLDVDGSRFRLWGMDAPDPEQTCAQKWPAGREAMAKLAELVRGRTVECESKGHDGDGRPLALCRVGDKDLGAAMVRAGMAWADLKTTHQYVLAEAHAAAAYLGVHAHHCRTAWDWRASNNVEPQFQRQ